MSAVAVGLCLMVASNAACRDKPAKKKVTPDDVAAVAEEPSVASRHWIGVVVPTDAQDVLAPYASTVTSMPVSVGQRLAVGDVVATLDPRPIQEELATARAALAASQAGLQSARVSHEAAIDQLKRTRAGVEAGFMAAEQVSIAEFEERRAAASVSQSAAAVEQQQASVKVLQNRAGRTQVRAMISGEVAKKYAEVGSKVEKEVPLLRIIGKRSLLLRFAVPLAESGKIVPGYKLTLSCLIADQTVVTSAEVTHMSPEADPVAQMVLGEATLMDVVGSTYTPGTVCRITR